MGACSRHGFRYEAQMKNSLKPSQINRSDGKLENIAKNGFPRGCSIERLVVTYISPSVE